MSKLFFISKQIFFKENVTLLYWPTGKTKSPVSIFSIYILYECTILSILYINDKCKLLFVVAWSTLGYSKDGIGHGNFNNQGPEPITGSLGNNSQSHVNNFITSTVM